VSTAAVLDGGAQRLDGRWSAVIAPQSAGTSCENGVIFETIAETSFHR
jgi:hypothetical protein